MACALEILGLQPGDMMCVLSPNLPEILVTDFACYSNRAIPVAIYATSSPEQIKYIIEDAGANFIMVGTQDLYKSVRTIVSECPTLKKIIAADGIDLDSDDSFSLSFSDMLSLGAAASDSCRADVALRTAEASPDDIATLIYTSGTTGEPKGAELLHSCFNSALEAHREILTNLSDKDTSVCFLPLSHIFEKAWTYLCLMLGIKVAINSNPKEIQAALPIVNPTCMCSVPRFWEKVYAGVQEKINETTGLKKALMLDAIRVGKIHNLDYLRQGKTPPMMNQLKYKFYEKTIYSLLKKTIGIENGNFFPTAGAAVPDEINEFVHSVGINMVVGYGLTESTATVSCTLPVGYDIGSVGVVLPGIEVKIGEDNEILLRGKTITKGYYKKAEATAAAIDSDGWFHTGDAGYFENGQLFLTERIKDLFKTSNGKYIAPQALETKLVIDRYIDQIAIIADRRKFVSALIVPVYGYVKEYAKEKGIEYKDMAELLRHPKIVGLFRARIETLQQQFAHYEQIKRFTLLPEPFSMERGELTNTLKLKRSVVARNYNELIEKMYQESEAGGK